MTSPTACKKAKKPSRTREAVAKGCFMFLAFLVVLVPEAATAGTPWDNTLNTIIGFLNAGTTRLIAILVIIGLGFLAWAGKLTMGRVGGAIAGIVLIFGAAAIADLFIAGV